VPDAAQEQLSARQRAVVTRGTAEAALLETRGLEKSFGALKVARSIDFRLERGARHALIGPNGAGKTTLVNMLSGALEPSAGRVLYRGADITDLSQAARVKLGVARTFQINRLFRGLSVLENVYMAVAERLALGPRLWRPAGKHPAALEQVWRLLQQLHLDRFAEIRIAELPYGRQRLVEIAIALALDPQVLLLDEPAAGVPSSESHIILDAVAALPVDIGVLIIDHDMDVVFRFAQRITVLVSGAVFAEGTPREIATNPDVRTVYLGQTITNV
jgi:ABC-type branched-subunit amino acid transport system ATPase component